MFLLFISNWYSRNFRKNYCFKRELKWVNRSSIPVPLLCADHSNSQISNYALENLTKSIQLQQHHKIFLNECINRRKLHSQSITNLRPKFHYKINKKNFLENNHRNLMKIYRHSGVQKK